MDADHIPCDGWNCAVAEQCANCDPSAITVNGMRINHCGKDERGEHLRFVPRSQIRTACIPAERRAV